MRRSMLSLMLSSVVLSAPQQAVTVEAERISAEPLLGPSKEPALAWASNGRFNPTAVQRGNKIALLFRAIDAKGTSRIGYAESSDGVHFEVRPEPILSPEASYEKDGGVEDPRVVLIDGTYYMTYTGYNKRDAQLCLATSKDLVHWERKGVLMPAYKGTWNTQWTKSGAIVPWRVQGKWWMYYMGTRTDADGKSRDHMGLASSTDLVHWTDATDTPVLERRPGAFDSRVMEPGPSPIRTPKGILLLYNGANEKLVYGPGWILFDADDPRKVIARSDGPFLLPQLPWEMTGTVPNVVFLEGAVETSRSDSRIELRGYYGAADRFIGAMRIRVAFLGL